MPQYPNWGVLRDEYGSFRTPSHYSLTYSTPIVDLFITPASWSVPGTEVACGNGLCNLFIITIPTQRPDTAARAERSSLTQNAWTRRRTHGPDAERMDPTQNAAAWRRRQQPDAERMDPMQKAAAWRRRQQPDAERRGPLHVAVLTELDSEQKWTRKPLTSPTEQRALFKALFQCKICSYKFINNY